MQLRKKKVWIQNEWKRERERVISYNNNNERKREESRLRTCIMKTLEKCESLSRFLSFWKSVSACSLYLVHYCHSITSTNCTSLCRWPTNISNRIAWPLLTWSLQPTSSFAYLTLIVHNLFLSLFALQVSILQDDCSSFLFIF